MGRERARLNIREIDGKGESWIGRMKVGWGRDYYGDGERRNGREIVRFDSQDISLTKYSERLQTRNLPVMSICTVSSMNQH